MNIKIQYHTNDERARIIQENINLFLIEEQNITEGNFLIFSDIIPEIEGASRLVYSHKTVVRDKITAE